MFAHNNIMLRPIEVQDLEFLRVMHNDWSTLQNLTDSRMINEIQQDAWFESMCLSKTSLRLAALSEEHGLIGCVRIDHIDPINRSAQVGGDIASDFRGIGLGSAMFSACLKYVFDVLNVRRAYLSVLETNNRAIGMYKKHGFQEEGRQIGAIYRLGEYFDYINMYLLESDYRSSK